MELDKKFDFKDREKEIYSRWEQSGFFNPDKLKAKSSKLEADRFSMVLPPPNATGTLHLGHAVMLVVQDILARFNRLIGKKVLWLPGTDHAGIATAEKVEKLIYKKEKKTRHDLGREEFLNRVDEFVEDSRDVIRKQVRAMGASLDWDRESFTLDDKRSRAVNEAFKRMYDAGLIYRGNRIVNWDPKMQTTVSDDEIEWEDGVDPFYYIKYGPFVIATARPETKFGDKYVVMHPEDKRYAEYKDGQEIELEWINGPIKATVIKDKAIDMEFGTGVMTITPWHDNTDFDIALRHDLDKEQIIDLNGKLLPVAGEFAGMHISKARPLIVEKLKEKGLLEKVDEKYSHRVAKNSRGGGMIEPQILDQWFVDVNKKFEFKKADFSTDSLEIKDGKELTLKELMQRAVREGKIKFLPERFEKIYFHWIDNLRDWCISRQLWYGHRIPVFYCSKKQEFQNHESGIMNYEEKAVVETVKPKECPVCGECEMRQDQDTLDTWFSSGLWTFSTLGWPEETEDLKLYHPTDVLETAPDIIFFWVARMILMSGFLIGDIPFKNVYFHGLLRDKEGKKMSKSANNGVDPIQVIEQYGADALRMSLIVGNAAGSDLVVSDDKFRAYRNFVTKVWNATRFVLMNYDDSLEEGELIEEDRKILDEFRVAKDGIKEHVKNFRLHLAAEEAYHYFWHTFADKIIEDLKPRLKEGGENRESAQTLIMTLLKEQLVMLHPFMPFVTEELYQQLPLKDKKGFLMIESWN
ncbi:MAG: valine--tRNA ligase [Candidatus Harrisonbacteria bacterium CG10_big_fil_rev_8_21_14_0_10_44_23]|uniref:valine--tRNA ligase n=1 Tax=Candidatus Harrisonbacteria bacterium CG10_big_fil_rev_8_21_14_0_10_44_23 TaxID=1974585 RepID=A0A2H0US09_9BACT|nr:MAG: valine--tRNA ligase [Candidatus Harrisonbacteria bacterium CG10_big_fil_rev_8_21_14_0_10_44_23]